MIRVIIGLSENVKIYHISDLLFSIGRSVDNAVVIDEPTVSAHHIKITWELSGYRLSDLGSSNGTWLTQGRIKEAWLEDVLECFLGNVFCRLEVCDPLLITELHGKYLMANDVCHFGRAVDNDWVIIHPTVSQHHGCFIREGRQVLIENYSQNGVKADGLPLSRSSISAGSEIEIGAVIVKLDATWMDIESDLFIKQSTSGCKEGEIELLVEGILGREQADQLAESLKKARVSGVRTIRLNLEKCRQLHPRSLEVLLYEVNQVGGRLPIVLLNPSDSVRRALALANATQSLPCIRGSN